MKEKPIDEKLHNCELLYIEIFSCTVQLRGDHNTQGKPTHLGLFFFFDEFNRSFPFIYIRSSVENVVRKKSARQINVSVDHSLK